MIVLLIGLGSVGRKHVKAIRSIYPESIIMALRSGINHDVVDGVINIYDWENIPYQPDFILIACPTYLHEEMIRKAAFIGAPIMVEKPLMMDIRNVHSTDEILKQNRIVTYVACNLRFHPVIIFLKENIGKKRLNEVNIYCGSYLPDWRSELDFKKTYSANENMGGGVHLDLIHEIDYCFWLFGKPEDINVVKRKVSSLGISSIDYANYIFSYRNFTVNIILNYYRTDSRRTIELLFNDVTWNADLINCEIIDSEGRLIFQHKFEIMDTYVAQIKYFIHCFEAGLEPMNNFYEAAEVLKLCLQ